MKKFLCFVAASIFATAALSTSAASASEFAKQAKVTMPQARQLALKVYPGKVVKEELEQEKGGSGLRYSFDISNGNVIHEVGIDAQSGKVLENTVESAPND